MPSILKCPVCAAPLNVESSRVACERGHSFDIARQGYVNLLLPDKRRGDEPGDSPDMMRSRRAFLRAGFYDGVAAAAADALNAAIAGREQTRVADLGCGEGYFLACTKRALSARHTPGDEWYGVDISRTGVRMATEYDRGVTWVVASIHNSPFLAHSIDAILSMWAPIVPAEFHRLLRKDGAVVTVTPGPDHLDALRAVIYSSVEPHASAALTGYPDFRLDAASRARYPITLRSNEQIMQLLAMTPFYWNISRETKARVEALSSLDLTVDAQIHVFRPL
jgi:23S rRNA (guanine745-N1)-methyltransferase